MKRYGRVYNPFSGYDIYPDENGKYVKYEDVEQLKADYDQLDVEVTYLREYTDYLVSFSKLPCLPKDLENLREANSKFAEENERLKREIIGWKNKWECALELAAICENKLEAIRDYLD